MCVEMSDMIDRTLLTDTGFTPNGCSRSPFSSLFLSPFLSPLLIFQRFLSAIFLFGRGRSSVSVLLLLLFVVRLFGDGFFGDGFFGEAFFFTSGSGEVLFDSILW